MDERPQNRLNRKKNKTDLKNKPGFFEKNTHGFPEKTGGGEAVNLGWRDSDGAAAAPRRRGGGGAEPAAAGRFGGGGARVSRGGRLGLGCGARPPGL